MSLLLQESGGERWAAAVQSPVPIRTTGRLSRTQRAVLLGFLVLFGLSQLIGGFAPGGIPLSRPAAPGGR
jgi:hypothetical protein